MAFWKKDEHERTTSETALDATLKDLPSNPSRWTSKQRASYSAASDKVMSENATRPGEHG